MPLVKAYDEIDNPRFQRSYPNGHFGWSTHFIPAPADKTMDAPMAFLAEGTPNRVFNAHFHEVDQFQLIYSGSGAIGKHAVKPGAVHFSRAHTPYGPLLYGAESGLGYITLRAHRDPGAQYLPESREALDRIPNRAPWQVTDVADFDIEPGESGVALKSIEAFAGYVGLAGWSVKMKPGAVFRAPDPSKGDGQFIVVLKGSIVHEGKPRNGLAVVWVGRQEESFELVAGPAGMEGLIVNFPVPGEAGKVAAAEPVAGEPDAAFKSWMCVICGFMYDEAAGLPEEGIAPGTRWADVPETFGCPDCSATKADFEMVEF